MTGRVLVVDDSLTVRMDLAAALEASGFEVQLCATAADARRALEGETFPLALLDVILPDGDGVEILAEIKRNSRSSATKVMLLSTESEVHDRIRGLSTGADDYVGKPYDAGYVVARAHELLRRESATLAVAEPARSKVLLIDDCPTFRDRLRQFLEDEGYRVFTAGTGEEGIRLAVDVRPDAILVDGVLPGMDGPTFVRRVRLDAALRRTPCLLLTGNDEPGGELRALDAGADAFVRKSEDLATVRARLGAVLRSAPDAGASVTSAGALGPRKILAVDDIRDVVGALAESLRNEGYEVASATSGEEALDLLAVEPVDCILLDMTMPGIGGLETCRRIKEAPKVRDTPLILLATESERDRMVEGLEAGADDFLVKTADPDVLKARVVAQLRRKQLEDENRRAREQLLRGEMEAAEARAARELAETRAHLLGEVRRKNEELEAFSYSVSHDLRAPLRVIDGFSLALQEDYGDRLDDDGRAHLVRVRDAAQRMDRLIQDLLDLSRVTQQELVRGRVNVSALAARVIERLRASDPSRNVEVAVDEDLTAEGDAGLLTVVLENLLGNAWKFTSKTADARIHMGRDEAGAFFVKDNGAGFDPAYASKLFKAFQRLHTPAEFQGTGIGLTTVYRIVDRHGGRIWADGRPGEGATFRFTLTGA